MEEASPARIGPYAVVGRIGIGGMGIVYEAVHAELKRKTALKVVDRSRPGAQELLARFRREAIALARVKHPNICEIYEIGDDPSSPYIAMQLVAGETLAHRLDASRVAVSKGGAPMPGTFPRTAEEAGVVFALFEKLANALDLAHRCNLVHRDVKPGNIMITPEGEPVLLDFGVAHDAAADTTTLTRSGEQPGTPAYMAPEQLETGRRVDGRADVFALGVTLYECLTLVRPFGAATLPQLYNRILHAPTPDPRTHNRRLARDVRTVLEACLEKDPARRYVTAGDLAEDLRRLRVGEPVRARQIGVVERLWLWSRRNRVASALIAVLVGSAASVTFLLLRADRALAMFDHLAVEVRVREGEDAFAKLPAPVPENVPAFEDWLRMHAAPIEALAADLAANRAELEAIAPERRNTRERYLMRALADLEARLREYADRRIVPATKLRDWALRASALSIDAHVAAWDAARERVGANVRYGGLVLAPQVGLVPLGPDPASHLEEFCHLASAQDSTAVPQRDADGKLALDAGSGIVFVLVPGGKTTLGSQSVAGRPYYDPHRVDDEDAHTLELDAFFLGKHEVTKEQWERLTFGLRPSEGAAAILDLESIGPRRPVDSVAWQLAFDGLRRQGLTLPTEAQWEHACRGGTTTIWYTGDERASLGGFENIGDRTAVRYQLIETAEDFDDGYARQAPVGSYAPNPFGLHDMLGNVREWCLDVYTEYGGHPPRVGDGLRTAGRKQRVQRGGSYASNALTSRSAARWLDDPEATLPVAGLRAARALQR